MSDRSRVLLVGMGVTTESALRGLLSKTEVVTLVRQAGPGDSAHALARSAGVSIVAETSIASIRAAIGQVRPDCVVVSSYHRILPPDVVRLCPFVNVHYAPLPRYRGRATVNWAIINGELCTAITVHELLPALDAGGILFQQSVPIGARDTVTDLYRRLNAIQELALPQAVARLLGGDRGVPQDESKASYACTRVPADGEIDWSRSAEEIDRLVRALTDPFPGAHTWSAAQRIVVSRAVPVTAVRYEGVVPGRVAAIDRHAGTVDVLTGSGVLRLEQVTLDGAPLRPADVIHSLSTTLGFDRDALVSALGELTRAVAELTTKEVVPR